MAANESCDNCDTENSGLSTMFLRRAFENLDSALKAGRATGSRPVNALTNNGSENS